MPHLESKTKLIMTASVNRYINTYFKQQHKQLAPQSKAPQKASFFGDPHSLGRSRKQIFQRMVKAPFCKLHMTK